MGKRFVSIWFRYLSTDWFTLRQHDLRNVPFVLRSPSHGRMIITSLNATAERKGIHKGMVLADARAVMPDLQVMDDIPDLPQRLLKRIAEWCIRFTPIVAVDPPDGILFDSTGCSHLWGGDEFYIKEIVRKLNARGYDVRAAIADTIGAAWALARYGNSSLIISEGKHMEALLPLPPDALRLENETVERLHKLGLHQIRQFIGMPRSSLRRRFGPEFIKRLNMALGLEIEVIEPVQPVEPYQERLPCLEPITTGNGIEIALSQLLEILCLRLKQEEKGIRKAVFKCFRVDGKVVFTEIGTNRATHHVRHLFKLFETKLQTIDPGLGIELFVLEATKVDTHEPQQEKMWEEIRGLEDVRLSELLDRLASKMGSSCIHRFTPAEHYWPDRSIKLSALNEKLTTTWRADKIRPLQLLTSPEPVDVTAPIPDYPPMLFRYKGKIHKIVKADGPERIEQEWWIQQGQHRDYYRVEDEDGHRYWLFRSGHYHDKNYKWFLHGFFA